LVPAGSTIYSRSNDETGFMRWRSLTHKDLKPDVQVPIIGLDGKGQAFTYTGVANDGGGQIDYSGKNVILDGADMSKDLNDKVGLAVVDDHGTIQPNSNELGKKIFGYSYCDTRTISPAGSQSQGH
jgi:hypothetical protein